MKELLEKEILNMEVPSDEDLANADFFSLALYLQELNKVKELY